jgi:hypothetical protein
MTTQCYYRGDQNLNVRSTVEFIDPRSTLPRISEITGSIFGPGKKEESVLLIRPVIKENIYYKLRMNK